MHYKQTKFHVLGTNVKVSCFVTKNISTIDILNKLTEVEQEFKRVEKKFTRFHSSSELSQLNMSSGKWFKASKELFALVESSIELAKLSSGKFDPTIIDLLELHGYKQSFDPDRINGSTASSKRYLEKYMATRPNWNEIELDSDNFKIRLASKQRMDLGGVGKGWAIDCAAKLLLDAGIKDFLIDAGGDIRASGSAYYKTSQRKASEYSSRAWQVELAIKLPPNYNAALDASNLMSLGKINLPSGLYTAIASSGSWVRTVGKFHHLLNPKTGKPSNQMWQVYCLAQDALTADGMATVAFLSDNHHQILTHTDCQILTIDSSGKIAASENFPV